MVEIGTTEHTDLSWVTFSEDDDMNCCVTNCGKQAVWVWVVQKGCSCKPDKPLLCLSHKEYLAAKLKDGEWEPYCLHCGSLAFHIAFERV